MRAPILLVSVLLLAGCQRGTWDDDPRNWARAFASELPDSLVVHSRFTRPAVFKRGYECWFELAPNADLARQLLGDGTLVRVSGREGWTRTAGTPEWFAPKSPQAYDAWTLAAGEPGRAFVILVDRATRGLYLADRQG